MPPELELIAIAGGGALAIAVIISTCIDVARWLASRAERRRRRDDTRRGDD